MLGQLARYLKRDQRAECEFLIILKLTSSCSPILTDSAPSSAESPKTLVVFDWRSHETWFATPKKLKVFRLCFCQITVLESLKHEFLLLVFRAGLKQDHYDVSQSMTWNPGDSFLSFLVLSAYQNPA